MTGIHSSARSLLCNIEACEQEPLENAVTEMKMKAIKAELDERGVAWRDTCFEREQLEAALSVARITPAPSPPPPSTAEASATTEAATNTATFAEVERGSGAEGDAGDPDAYAKEYTIALEHTMAMRVKVLREELAARQLGWADLYEKEELAARLAAAIARAALFSVSGALTPGKVSLVSGEQLRAEITDARTPMVVDVFATWCGPCKMIAPMLEKLSKELGEKARVAKMDSDLEQELSTELRVAGLPTLIFFKEGKEVHRLEGVPRSSSQLRALVEDQLGV